MNRSIATVGQLAAANPLIRLVGDPAETVGGVAYDSRLVGPGDLFAALRGADADGHAFVTEAIRRGAAALLLEQQLDLPVPQLIVPDSRAALPAVAAAFYGHPSRALGVIGITGTDGKTTTSYLVDAILRVAGHVTGMVGTVVVRTGTEVVSHDTRQTTPESADLQRYLRSMLDAGATWATLEATSHGLAMHRLDHIRFSIGAVTNITHEHLDYHGSIAGYRRAKAILFERLATAGGTAVVNVDDPGAEGMLAFVGNGPIIDYSAEGRTADLSAVGVRSDHHGSRFDLRTTRWGGVRIELPLIGEFNVANALCAAGVALAAGVDLAIIARALSEIGPVPGRMAGVDAGQPFSVVVDYAHTPDAVAKVLSLLRHLHPGGRLIAVFGSAGERDVEKRPLQGAVAARLADYAVFTSEDPRCEDPDGIIAQIAEGATAAGGSEGDTFVRITDRREALRHALTVARPGDCVLLAGKGHEGSIIWGREKQPWDEAGVAREVLAELGYPRPS